MVGQLEHSGRRAFLQGIGGTALALPLLEYTHGHIWGSDAHAAQNDAARRFITVFSHGGTISNMEKGGRVDGLGPKQGNDWWRPADASSEALVLGPIHQPLAPWVDRLLVLEGVDNRAAIVQHQYGQGGHGTANVTALTAADVGSDGDDATSHGPSIDQIVAERLAARQTVPFDRIHLRVPGHQYGSPYFRADNQRVSGEDSPKAAFDTLFAGVTGGEPDPAVLALNAKRTSVLVGLQEGYADFRGRVSAHDMHAIDAHLEHLHALEQQLADPIVCTPPTGIDADDGPGDVIGSLHAQIIVAAIRCGLTNVANLEIADILSPWTPNASLRDNLSIGLDIGHALGHLARDIGPTGPNASELDDWLQYTLENRQWRMSLIAEILEGLDDPNFLEGDRTVLDNSLMLCTSEFSNGSRHISWNVPVLLAGSAGGYFRTGRFVNYNAAAADDPDTLAYDTQESTHNLFTSVLQAMGESDAHFGNGDAFHEGPLPNLT
jgi:hypothetical protein